MEQVLIVETGATAFLFAAIFVIGDRIRPFRILAVNRRSINSFSAGMSVAYVFVHLMPELHGARTSFASSASAALRYEGMAVYLMALVGFLVSYGFLHLPARLGTSTATGYERLVFRLHLGGFAVYAWLVAYLLVRNLEETEVSTALYAIAMACHFLAVSDGLRREHGPAYERVGRFVLAGMSIAGWSAGIAFPLPVPMLAMLIALVSGAVIMTSTIMELPSGKDGRFLPFVSGGLTYGLILLPLAG
ncbi:hypothetical protein [Paraburkholderia dilworthii]|uniref:hypothetical protein n=1 Tax=Paraburkholderia dilworthii TaxID=948106 RepID=UPI0003FBFE3F|nr:hypothetical protein [Paraburkholderia dilworthii]